MKALSYFSPWIYPYCGCRLIYQRRRCYPVTSIHQQGLCTCLAWDHLQSSWNADWTFSCNLAAVWIWNHTRKASSPCWILCLICSSWGSREPIACDEQVLISSHHLPLLVWSWCTPVVFCPLLQELYQARSDWKLKWGSASPISSSSIHSWSKARILFPLSLYFCSYGGHCFYLYTLMIESHRYSRYELNLNFCHVICF